MSIPGGRGDGRQHDCDEIKRTGEGDEGPSRGREREGCIAWGCRIVNKGWEKASQRGEVIGTLQAWGSNTLQACIRHVVYSKNDRTCILTYCNKWR